MKQIIVNGTVLYEVRPGVYESAGPGVILREHNTGEIIKARRQELMILVFTVLYRFLHVHKAL